MEYLKNKKKFSLHDKKKVALIALERKRKYEQDLKDPKKHVWNEKRKRWVNPISQTGYIGPTVRECFSDLREVANDSADFLNACKFVNQCVDLEKKGKFDIEGNCSKKHFRVAGAGPPTKAVEVRNSLFEYFIDVRTALKGRLPKKLFLAKAKELLQSYNEERRKRREDPETILFSNRWLKGWCKQFHVSMKRPNKRFSITQEKRKRRIISFLKNIWTARYFFEKKYGVNPAILSADQMPLHRNESSSAKTMNFVGQNQSTFVKENYKLSRERSTVMTTVSSSNKVPAPPCEYLFKGKGTRVKLSPPAKTKVQWAEKGSYRLQNLLQYVENLPAQPVALFPQKRVIFTLDDYSVHLDPSIQEAMYKKGYFLIIIGGGITGDIQCNDTHYHRRAKGLYRDREMAVMIDKLREHPEKIPAPTRDDMMEMFSHAWKETCQDVDGELAFKQNMVTIAFDGSEDHLVSAKLMDLVGEDMKAFRAELLKSKVPHTFRELERLMTPPEGVVRKRLSQHERPEDEGVELFDAEETIAEEEFDSDADSELDEKSDDEQDGAEQANSQIEKESTEIDCSTSSNNINIGFLEEMREKLREGKKRCEIHMMPFLVKMENTVSEARHMCLNHEKQKQEEALRKQTAEEQTNEEEGNCFDLFAL